MIKKCFLIIIFIGSVSVLAEEKGTNIFSVDYGKEIPKRASFLNALMNSDYPESARLVSRLVETSGLIGIRDYLIMLGTNRPDFKSRIVDMPISFGIQGAKSNGIQHPRITLYDFLDLNQLDKNLFNKEKEYSYYDLAQIIEKTISDWVRDPGALPGEYDVIGRGRALFWYSPRDIPKTNGDK